MSLQRYFDEIESLQFQIKFSVVGGFEILKLVMERNPTICRLIATLRTDRKAAKRVFERITLLLSKVDSETELSYDESIAAYLHSLAEVNSMIAYRASLKIIRHGGLWWSVQLAHFVKDDAKQRLDKFVALSESVETFSDAWVSPAGANIDYLVSPPFAFEVLQSAEWANRDASRFFRTAGSWEFDYHQRPVSDTWVSYSFVDPADRMEWTFAERESA